MSKEASPLGSSAPATGYATDAVEAALVYADEGMNAATAAKMILQQSPDYRLGGYNHLALIILAAEVRHLRAALSDAYGFVDSHVADPDITEEMAEKHYKMRVSRFFMEARKSHNNRAE